MEMEQRTRTTHIDVECLKKKKSNMMNLKILSPDFSPIVSRTKNSTVPFEFANEIL